MKSVGEAMAIGRTFKEALQKGLRSLEVKVYGWEDQPKLPPAELEQQLRFPGANRIFYLKQALQQKMGVEKIYQLTGIDPWFLENLKELIEFEERLKRNRGRKLSGELLRQAKKLGFSDRQLAGFQGKEEQALFAQRGREKIQPEFKQVDTCAAEFEAYTPYYYSTYS
jgi:carbamoyl-phosphate synthase large subunit